MAQHESWEREYRNSLFVTKNSQPQNDTLRFFRFAKNHNIELSKAVVLDLGSGTGRNANYLAELGANVTGLEISSTAIEIAEQRAKELKLGVKYLNQSIGQKFQFENETFDLMLDVTSSNALNSAEREVYLSETHRTLQKNGLFFVRALCKDGDKNAKKLLELFPGKEADSYVMPKSNLVERVFSEKDFRQIYGKYFKILKLQKKSGYTIFDGQPYKRNYFLAYMTKK